MKVISRVSYHLEPATLSLAVTRCLVFLFGSVRTTIPCPFSFSPNSNPSTLPSSPLSSTTVSGRSSVNDAALLPPRPVAAAAAAVGIGAKYGAPYGCVLGTLRGEFDGAENTDEGVEAASENVDPDETLDRGESGAEPPPDACTPASDASVRCSELSILRGPDVRRGGVDGVAGRPGGDDKTMSCSRSHVGFKSQKSVPAVVLGFRGLIRKGLTNVVVKTSPLC